VFGWARHNRRRCAGCRAAGPGRCSRTPGRMGRASKTSRRGLNGLWSDSSIPAGQTPMPHQLESGLFADRGRSGMDMHSEIADTPRGRPARQGRQSRSSVPAGLKGSSNHQGRDPPSMRAEARGLHSGAARSANCGIGGLRENWLLGLRIVRADFGPSRIQPGIIVRERDEGYCGTRGGHGFGGGVGRLPIIMGTDCLKRSWGGARV